MRQRFAGAVDDHGSALRSCPDELWRAGFSDIQVFGDFTDEAATADHKELFFVCRK
jgi:hypothetical protein